MGRISKIILAQPTIPELEETYATLKWFVGSRPKG
jgi:hypothetical protein